MFGFLKKKATDHCIEKFDEYTKRCARCGASWVAMLSYHSSPEWVEFSLGDKSATCYEKPRKEKFEEYERSRIEFLRSGADIAGKKSQ